MLDIMYELPSKVGVKECIITKEVVEKGEKPRLIFEGANVTNMEESA